MNRRDDAAVRQLDAGLRPATQQLEAARHAARTTRAAAVAVRTVPRFTVALAIGTLAFGLLTPLPWWLPAALLTGLGLLAFLIAKSALPGRAATTLEGALAVDRSQHTHDRLAAAYELAEAAPRAGADLPEALARAAIEDGLATLARVDGGKPALPAPPRRPAWAKAAGCLLALLLLPLLLPDVPPGRAAGPSTDAGERATAGPAGEAPPNPARATARTDTPPSPRGEREGERREPRPKPGSPPPPPPKAEPVAAVPAASGQGQAGSDAAGDSSQTGAPKAAPAGKAGSGQSGGGAGAAASGAPEPQAEEKQAKAPPKPKPGKPKADPPQQDGKPSESAGAPSGPSRGSGRLAAVGNKRNDQNRGLEREDDPEVEDEAVEDESDEQEQRGGVMPMRRGDNRPAARELSISGDGPPDNGRGGPTPPKKARGTASLVLGLRLPDSVRGQPNPGTAKTSLEQIPPRPNTAAAGLASAAGQGRPATPQSPRHPASASFLLQAYHQWLAAQEPLNPAIPPTRPR